MNRFELLSGIIQFLPIGTFLSDDGGDRPRAGRRTWIFCKLLYDPQRAARVGGDKMRRSGKFLAAALSLPGSCDTAFCPGDKERIE